MVANRRAWDMGAAAFNDPSPPLSLSLSPSPCAACLYMRARALVGAFFYANCERCSMLVSSGSAGVSRAARASDIQQRPAAGA